MVHQLLQLRRHWYITHYVPTRPAGPRPILPTCPRPPGTRQTRPSGIRPPPRLPGPDDRPHPARPTGSRPTATARPAITTPARSGGPAPDRVLPPPDRSPRAPLPPSAPRPPLGFPLGSCSVRRLQARRGALWSRRKIELKMDFSAAILVNFLNPLEMNTPRLR